MNELWPVTSLILLMISGCKEVVTENIQSPKQESSNSLIHEVGDLKHLLFMVEQSLWGITI